MPERQGQGRAGRKTRAGAQLTLNLDPVHGYRDRVWAVRDLTGARVTDQPVECNSAPQVASRSETSGRQARVIGPNFFFSPKASALLRHAVCVHESNSVLPPAFPLY